MYGSKRLPVWFLFCVLALNLASLWVPQANAVLPGSSFIEEVTGASGNAYMVDVDSAGRIFLCDGSNDIWRSTDNGAIFTKVYDGSAYTMTVPLILFVDSNDYIFASVRSGSNWDLYRSTNHGDSWAKVGSDNLAYGRTMDESNDGVLYLGRYTNTNQIYNSTDGGTTWNLMLDQSGVKHCHVVGVAPNDWIYAAFGDNPNSKFIRYNSTAWETLESGNAIAQAVGFEFFGDYCYVFPDTDLYVRQFPYAGSWADNKKVWWTEPFVGSAWCMDAQVYGDIMFFGTYKGALWATFDGERYVKLWEDAAADIRTFSTRRPIYFNDATAKKLYRVNIQKGELVQLFFATYLKKDLTNAENYVLEQPISNGTNYVDLTSVALSNVQASIKGLSRWNEMLAQSSGNSGFEWANATGWTISTNSSTYGLHWFTTSDKHSGSYSLKVQKDQSATSIKYVDEATGSEVPITKAKGDVLLFSCYVKANVSLPTGALTVTILGGTDNPESSYIPITTEWTRVSWYFVFRRAYAATENCRVRLKIARVVGTNYDIYIDDCQLEPIYAASTIPSATATEENCYFHGGLTPSTYHTAVSLTTNPNLTINGQTISHSGTLANGTESTPTSLTGILTGAVQVDASIEGSEQAILRLTGTRIFGAANVTLQGYETDWYYGRYSGTPTYPSEKCVLTTLSANITSLTASPSQLSFTITAPSELPITINIYCGDLQKPEQVDGLTSVGIWSYDDSSKILTIADARSNSLSLTSLTFTVSWSGSASDKNTLTVQDINQTTDLLGQTHWLLPYHSYGEHAYYGEQKQSLTVLLNEDKTAGFNFVVLPKPPNFTTTIHVLVVVVAFLMLYFLLPRKH